jgi:hypothetical protein
MNLRFLIRSSLKLVGSLPSFIALELKENLV